MIDTAVDIYFSPFQDLVKFLMERRDKPRKGLVSFLPKVRLLSNEAPAR